MGSTQWLIPSHCIQVDIERLLFSLAVKLHNFWGPLNRQKGDQFFYQMSDFCENCAILTPHILPPLLVNVWLIFDLQKHVNFVYIFKDFYGFEKWEFIARQFEHAVLYVVGLHVSGIVYQPNIHKIHQRWWYDYEKWGLQFSQKSRHLVEEMITFGLFFFFFINYIPQKFCDLTAKLHESLSISTLNALSRPSFLRGSITGAPRPTNSIWGTCVIYWAHCLFLWFWCW